MADGEAGSWRGAGEVTVTPGKSARAARAVEALMARHAELREVLDHWAGALAAAADSGRPARPVRNLLHAFLADEVLPHARAEERTLYRAARRDPDTSLFASHVAKEGCLLRPALERSGADLAALLAREPRLADSQCAA
jgi:hypothetical protein